jgi:nucleotide-binding universal stress UspA family protein
VRDEVLKRIEAVHADAVIIGSRGLGAIRRMIVGSLSTFLIHNLDIPVTVVRAPSSTPAVVLDDDKSQD